MSSIIYNITWDAGDVTPEVYEMIERLKIGDFIHGLTYPRLLIVEEKLRVRIKNAKIMMTGTGYGFVSEWFWD